MDQTARGGEGGSGGGCWPETAPDVKVRGALACVDRRGTGPWTGGVGEQHQGARWMGPPNGQHPPQGQTQGAGVLHTHRPLKNTPP